MTVTGEDGPCRAGLDADSAISTLGLYSYRPRVTMCSSGQNWSAGAGLYRHIISRGGGRRDKYIGEGSSAVARSCADAVAGCASYGGRREKSRRIRPTRYLRVRDANTWVNAYIRDVLRVVLIYTSMLHETFKYDVQLPPPYQIANRKPHIHIIQPTITDLHKVKTHEHRDSSHTRNQSTLYYPHITTQSTPLPPLRAFIPRRPRPLGRSTKEPIRGLLRRMRRPRHRRRMRAHTTGPVRMS